MYEYLIKKRCFGYKKRYYTIYIYFKKRKILIILKDFNKNNSS